MAAPSLTHDERAAREAIDWLIARSERPDDAALQARFTLWLDADPANRMAWHEACRVDALVADAGALARVTPRARPRRAAGRFVAAAVAAACLALLLGPAAWRHPWSDYATGAAELRSISLPDGSTVRLAPDSTFDLAFAGAERRVQLGNGEAYLEVAPDPTRPFQVEAGSARISVIGTGFGVQLKHGVLTVAVRHGVVRVEDPAAAPPVAARLGTGDWLRVARNGTTVRGVMPADQVAAWRHGQLIARDQQVAAIVDALRPYYRGLIMLRDDTIGRQRVTGVYDLHDPESALRAIAAAHGAVVHRPLPWLLLIGSD
jgi:transmembrane sensor